MEFEKKDYRNAAIKYEIEVMSNANAYLNLGKSYFALQEFEQAIEALENYKKEGTDVDLDYVNNFVPNRDYIKDSSVKKLYGSDQFVPQSKKPIRIQRLLRRR